jgi:hypothetical protein
VAVDNRHDPAFKKPAEGSDRVRELGEPLPPVHMVHKQDARCGCQQRRKKRNAIRNVDNAVEQSPVPPIEKQSE